MADTVLTYNYNMPYNDMDFLGFTFNGKHSYLDLGVIRIINDRIQTQLSPDISDLTAESAGSDGMYFFGSYHKSRKFTVDFAFDNLTETQLRDWKKFCSYKDLSDLIFDEEPYKVYTAKITGAPILKTIPFEDNGERVYKGEGTLEFTCYWPYAHTPDENTKVSTHFISDGKFFGDGKVLDSYPEALYPTKNQWAPASGLDNSTADIKGDLPTYFVANLSPYIPAELIYNDNKTICYGYKYNSSTDSEKALIIKPEATVSSLEKNTAIEGGITWNVGGGYNDNPMRGLYAIDLSDTNITSIPDYCFATTENIDNTIIDIKLPKNLTYLGDMFTARSQLNTNAENCKYDTYLTDNGMSLNYGEYINGNSKTLYKLGAINLEKSSFAIQDGTKFLASYCCNGCKAKHIIVPEGVIEICAGAFANCENLASVTIPKTVTHINKWVFDRTPSELVVYFNGTEAEYGSITKDSQSGISSKTIICTLEE